MDDCGPIRLTGSRSVRLYPAPEGTVEWTLVNPPRHGWPVAIGLSGASLALDR